MSGAAKVASGRWTCFFLDPESGVWSDLTLLGHGRMRQVSESESGRSADSRRLCLQIEVCNRQDWSGEVCEDTRIKKEQTKGLCTLVLTAMLMLGVRSRQANSLTIGSAWTSDDEPYISGCCVRGL